MIQPDSWSYINRAWVEADPIARKGLADVISGDHLKINVTVAGNYTYDNTVGGGNTVPALLLDSFETLDPLTQ